jgi:hypothetical protein
MENLYLYATNNDLQSAEGITSKVENPKKKI